MSNLKYLAIVGLLLTSNAWASVFDEDVVDTMSFIDELLVTVKAGFVTNHNPPGFTEVADIWGGEWVPEVAATETDVASLVSSKYIHTEDPLDSEPTSNWRY